MTKEEYSGVFTDSLAERAYWDMIRAIRPGECRDAYYIGGCWHGRRLPLPPKGVITAGDPKDGHRYVFTGRGNVMVWDKIILESRQWAGTQENLDW